MISIGAGGGSIAWIDELGGGLRVGPQSASSLPGPCCYDRGGEEPTVTDADLILGYIAPEATFGSQGERGGFKPRRDLAEKAIKEKVADPLGLSVDRRRARHRRGREREDGERRWRTRSSAAASTRATSSSCPTAAPGRFHAAGYAAALGVETIVVPGEAASVWSAFGISQADIRYQYESSVVADRAVRPGRG